MGIRVRRLTGNAGIAIPVIGVGLITQATGPINADFGFAVTIALLALVALATGVKYAPEG